MQNPLVEKLNIRAADAIVVSQRKINDIDAYVKVNNFCAKSYQEGKSVAYTDAAVWALEELRRLKQEFQDGVLTIDSFSQIA